MFISYAQNFEDVMLWRALKHVQNSLYIDIGAQDPVIDSVSLAFYEHGWRGVHVEPIASDADKLRRARPDETVIQAALSSKAGVLKFFEIADTGLSTGEPQIAEDHRAAGYVVRETDVPCVTLASILDRYPDREIHWLKIDVEGMEEEVLQGWLPSTVRPWVVVIESTLPNTQVPAHERWEPQLIDLGYAFVYFDGLNRFYVSKAHQDLKDAFRSGPNCFDAFALSGTSTSRFCSYLNQKIGAQQEETQRLSQALAQSEREIGEIQAQLQHSREETQRLSQTLAKRDREGETQANKLRLVYASWSWRLAAPLRKGNALAHSALSAIAGIPSKGTNIPKAMARPLVASAMRFVLTHPALKTRFLIWVGQHPSLKARLRLFAVNSGLIAKQQETHFIEKLRSLKTSGASLRANASRALPKGARTIYDDLVRAMRAKS